ncbi:hypothetical protein EUX98_g4159 [Antrodiella citrinella]|uniref:WLM domain-containing protein n=1 Tax=Antrodiella citrinella TaxID=2447956 RepID=A0A4S4N2S2_9APHY|nr:hypothetical protein EUX98_g4159 [Antrodiella citrinella]
MVNLRLNEREPNPNPHINFTQSLPLGDEVREEDARQQLRALAAQVRPVMKAHGFVINRFEEYKYNKVFAGRNWNNGEVVEIVLRGPTGAYYSSRWLLSTLCHELAHIKVCVFSSSDTDVFQLAYNQHMNHGPEFQALWSQLRKEVKELQSKGYYGDGYWSSGTRLADSAVILGPNGQSGDLPEYMCGGAQSRKRPSSLRQRRPPSTRTGAQTTKKRKAGSRVTARGMFKGDGHALNEGLDDEEKKKGAGFRKKAVSNRAREERAIAAEKRLQALLSKSGTPPRSDEDSDDETGSDREEETDADRRRAMLDTISETDLKSLKTSRDSFINEFFLPSSQSPPEAGPSWHRELSTPCDAASGPSTTSKGKGKRPLHQTTLDSEADADDIASAPSSRAKKKQKSVSYGSIVSDEVKFRKKEALGLTGEGTRFD